MPTYDYVCSACGHRVEVVHGLNEDGPAACPACGGPVSRAFAPPTIVFKGSGWARTDRRATSTHRKKPSSHDADDAPRRDGQAGSTETRPADSAPAGDSSGSSSSADSSAGDSAAGDSAASGR